jgi:hypothetical protein
MSFCWWPRSSRYRADGTRIGHIGELVDYRAADKVYRYTRSRGSAWIMDVAHDRSCHPIVLYFRRDSKQGDVYRCARFNGKHWRDREIVRAGRPTYGSSFYQAGATLAHEDPSVVYLSRRLAAHTPHEVEIWTTPDHGVSWASVAVTKRSGSDNWRPVGPRGYPGYQVLFWNGKWINFRTYDTKIVVGLRRAASHR